MDILNDDLKKELKLKFQELDINDDKFQEKAQAIIDEAILGNKDKIGETVVQKTVDEELEDRKKSFEELEQLMKDGDIDILEDADLKDKLEKQAVDKIVDEEAEKSILEGIGFLKEPSKETTIEDIVEEILKQLEEVIEEKKQEIEKKLEKNSDMLGKIEKRERLRASKVKFGNLHQRTKNYKGGEGEKLNQNVEAAITDLDKQIDALVVATTIDGNELQSEELKKEREQLKEEKKKLEDMSKFLRERYTKNKSQEASKVIVKERFQNQIKQIMEIIEFCMAPEELLKCGERMKELYKVYADNGVCTKEELKEYLKEIPLEADKEIEGTYDAYKIASLDDINTIRKNYIKLSNKENPTQEERKKIEKYREQFDKKHLIIEDICDDEILPLLTETEYISQLEELEEDAQETGFMAGIIKSKKAKEANSITKELHPILTRLMDVFKDKSTIKSSYKRILNALTTNKSLKGEEMPKDLEETKNKPTMREEVKVEVEKEEEPKAHDEHEDEEIHIKMPEVPDFLLRRNRKGTSQSSQGEQGEQGKKQDGWVIDD